MSSSAAPATSVLERRLYLLRHAQWTESWSEDRVSSWSDAPLTATGRAQAHALRELFAPSCGTCVHASDLARSRQTAEALGRPVRLHEGLREISLGALEGATLAQLERAAPNFLGDPDVAPPEGESFRQAARRASRALGEILAADGSRDVIVVAHSAVNRGMIAELLGLSARAALRMRQDWACVNVLEHAAGRWWLGALNWTASGVEALRHPPDRRLGATKEALCKTQ